ncbi:hypothetical protein BURK2_01986 [Burkholderiales bacterium]|nr:hypothetical protein BURK2_01986 [Burkholderiales bacterium]
MLRSISFSILVVAVVGIGGWYYYAHQRTLITQTAPSNASQQPVVIALPKQSDDELKKKRQEGIGSIKDLKSVPLDPHEEKVSSK